MSFSDSIQQFFNNTTDYLGDLFKLPSYEPLAATRIKGSGGKPIPMGNIKYTPYTVGDTTQYLNPNTNTFVNAQGIDSGYKLGLDGKAYKDNTAFANSIGTYGNLALQGAQSLGNLLMGNKMLGLAQDQFNFQKDYSNRTLANSIKSYNTALTDRVNSRYAFEGRSQAEADDYIKKHSL